MAHGEFVAAVVAALAVVAVLAVDTAAVVLVLVVVISLLFCTIHRRLQHKFATEREFAAFSGSLLTGTHTKTLALAETQTQAQAQAQHTLWMKTRSAHAGALTCLSECLSKTDTTKRLSTGHSAAIVRLYPCVCVCVYACVVLVRECVGDVGFAWTTRTALATPTPAAMISSRAEQSKQSKDSQMRSANERETGDSSVA